MTSVLRRKISPQCLRDSLTTTTVYAGRQGRRVCGSLQSFWPWYSVYSITTSYPIRFLRAKQLKGWRLRSILFLLDTVPASSTIYDVMYAGGHGPSWEDERVMPQCLSMLPCLALYFWERRSGMWLCKLEEARPLVYMSFTPVQSRDRPSSSLSN